MFEATIIANVGSVKLVSTPGKMDVLNINAATNRKIGEREFTDWVSCKVWGERASKLAPHIQKGARLLLRGRPEAKPFKKNDGTPGAELVLHVDTLEFLSTKKSGENGNESDEYAEPERELAAAGAGAGKTQRRRG